MAQELPNIFALDQQQQQQAPANVPTLEQQGMPTELPNIFAAEDPQEELSWGQEIGGTAAGVAEMLTGAITGPLSGLHGAGTFAATGDLERAIENIEYWQQYTPAELASKVGVPEQYIYNHAYDRIMKIPELVDKGADYLGEWARAHSGDNETYSSAVGAATKSVATLITYVLGAKGAGAGIGKAQKTWKDARGKKSEVPPQRKIYENEKELEEVASLVDDAIGRTRPDTDKGPGGTGAVAELRLEDLDGPKKAAPGSVRPSDAYAGPTQPDVIPFAKVDEPIAPIQKQGIPELPKQEGQGDLFAQQEQPSEFARSVLPDEAAARLEESMPAKGSPAQGVLPFIEGVEGQPGIPKGDGMSVGMGRQGRLDFENDLIFEDGAKAYNKPGFLRTANDVIAARSFKKTTDRMDEVNAGQSGGPVRRGEVPGTRINRGFGGKQSGALDPNILKDALSALKRARDRMWGEGKNDRGNRLADDIPVLEALIANYTRNSEGLEAGVKEGWLTNPDQVRNSLEKTEGRINDILKRYPESKVIRDPSGKQGGAANFGAAEWIVDKAGTVGKRIKAFMNGGKPPEHFYAPREHMPDWDKLSPEEKDVIPDTRTLGDVLDDVMVTTVVSKHKNVKSKTIVRRSKSTGRNFKDISKGGAIFFTESNIRSYYSENPILKSTIDRVAEINVKWDRINEALRENEVYSGIKNKLGAAAWKLFSPNLKSSLMRQEAGVLGRIDSMNTADKLTLFKAMHKFDNHPDLHANGLMWATRDMLKKEGLNDTQISVYQHWTKIADNSYDILDYGWRLAKPNSKGIRRIPGYFPHMYRGKYEVRIEDNQGNLIFWTRAESKAMAYKLWEKIQANARQSSDPIMQKVANEGRMLEPTKNENATSVQGMVEAYEQTLRLMDQNHGATKGIQKLFDGIRASLNAGSISHAMNRAGVKGYLSDSFWGDKQFIKESRKSLENYIHAVTEFAKKQEIIAKVENPLKAAENKIAGDLQMPNTYEFLRRRIEAYKGTPVDVFGKSVGAVEKVFDNVAETVVSALSAGRLSPPSARDSLQFVRNWFTTMKIGFYKPVYLAMNVLQPHFMGLQVMVREKARLGKGNPWLEALRLDLNILDMPGARADAETKALVLRAMKEKKLNPSLMENTDFMTTKKLSFGERARRVITGRSVAEHIESVGRMKSLVYAYRVYKSAGMSKEAAYQSATRVIDEIMMNYDRVKRPAMYQDYGIVGEAMSPFATFAHGQLGNGLITAKLAMRLAKEGKPIRALEPVFANVVVSMFFAGAMGLVGWAELDLIAKIINGMLNHTPVEFRVPELMKWVGRSEDISKLVGPDKTIMGISTHDSIKYGVLSAATRNIPGMEAGINIGGGMSAPAFNELLSAPSMGWLKDLFYGDESAIMSAIRISSGNATKNDYWNFANKTFIPSSVTGIAARAQAVEQGQFDWGTEEDWMTKMTPKERDKLLPSAYPNIHQSGQGSVNMSPEAWRTRMFTGTKSLDETQARWDRTREKDYTNSRRSRVINLYKRAADAMESGKVIPADVIDAAAKEGVSIRELYQQARTKAWARPVGEIERGMGKKPTPAHQQKLDRLGQ